jgi:hypothetical protein
MRTVGCPDQSLYNHALLYDEMKEFEGKNELYRQSIQSAFAWHLDDSRYRLQQCSLEKSFQSGCPHAEDITSLKIFGA